MLQPLGCMPIHFTRLMMLVSESRYQERRDRNRWRWLGDLQTDASRERQFKALSADPTTSRLQKQDGLETCRSTLPERDNSMHYLQTRRHHGYKNKTALLLWISAKRNAVLLEVVDKVCCANNYGVSIARDFCSMLD